MPKIKVNGREIDAPAGSKVLEVLTKEGITVPYYCWHPGLSPHGNCRMCLVKVSNSRKLEASCMYPVSDNLEVTTEGPDVETARKYVLEYMLINHPLDCPICDKSGECMLQDHTFDHRHGVSRFAEEKVVKPTKDLGPTVKIWGSRCISCTRCVRFTEEVTGTGELALANRGDHSVADVHPEVPLDNPMSLNVVDICPVGALISKDFLYQARVWFTKPVDSVCPSCSRGCNITTTTMKNQIKRVQPRHNPAVNDYWMCDSGRLHTGFVSAPNRLYRGKGSPTALAENLRDHAGKVGIIASTWLTLEELHALKILANGLGAKVGFFEHKVGERWVAKNGFSIETDKTPNTRGAQHVFGNLVPAEQIAADVESGALSALFVINSIPDFAFPPAVVAAASKAKLFALADLLDNPLRDVADTLIGSSTWAEKDGTFMNKDGRIQRIRPMIAVQGSSRPELVWLQEMLFALGERSRVMSPEGVFRSLFPGVNYARIGTGGATLEELAAPPAEASSPAVPGGAK